MVIGRTMISKFFTFICLAVLAVLCSSQVQQGPLCTILPLSPTAWLVNPCVGIVDYPYYIPAGYTNTMLAKNVTSRIDANLLGLDLACQR